MSVCLCVFLYDCVNRTRGIVNVCFYAFISSIFLVSLLSLPFIYLYFFVTIRCATRARSVYLLHAILCAHEKKNALEFLSSFSLVEAGKNPLSLSTAAECTENAHTHT